MAMAFIEEDNVFIKVMHQEKKFIKEFANKNWSLS